MIAKILLGLIAIVFAILIIAASRPSEFRIERHISISALPAALFAKVNDFHRWPAWSPYEKLDPALKRTYEGPPAGTGASYAWAGNSQVGAGRMTVVESIPNELVGIRLEFLKPFPSTNTAEFLFKPAGAQTSVTWRMSGKYSFVPKVIGLFVNMEKMIGAQFDVGLANLKQLAESKGPR